MQKTCKNMQKSDKNGIKIDIFIKNIYKNNFRSELIKSIIPALPLMI
jgi:hypothetical protein